MSSSRHHYVMVFAGMALQNLVLCGLSIVLARLFGSSLSMNAYRAAITIPIAVSTVLAGAISPILITVIGRREQGIDQSAFSGAVLTGTAFFSLLLALLGSVFSQTIMTAVLPNYSIDEVEFAAQIFSILVWLIPLNALTGLFQSVLQASMVFAVPSLAGVIGPFTTLVIAMLWGRSHGIMAVAWGTVIGAAVSLLVQLPGVMRKTALRRGTGFFFKFQSLLLLGAPILGLILLQRLDPVVDLYVCPRGNIAHLNWALQVVTIFVMLSSGTISTVAFPRIARHADKQGEEFRKELGTTLHVLVLLCLPAFFASFFFGGPLIHDVVEGEHFTAQDTLIVSQLIQAYSFLIFGALLGEFGVKTFYALHDSVTPTVVVSAALVLGFLAKFLFISDERLVLLPAITSAASIGAGACLLWLLYRRTGRDIFEGLLKQILRSLLGAGVALTVGGAILQTTVPYRSLLGLVAGGVAYFATLWLIDRDSRKVLRRSR